MTQPQFTGGCLCGSVKYSVSGDVQRFSHCHCSRCRKVSGAGHASNILVMADTVNWIQGESLLGYYKVPEAERFHNRFCKQCGSPLPRTIPELGAVLIPAGSLDSMPDIKPDTHIFWGSRADWSCDAGGVPTFAEYPNSG